MDAEQNIETWKNFTTLVKVGCILTVVVLVLMALFLL